MKSLERLTQLEYEAREFGFEWPNSDMIFEQILSECEEIKSAIKDQEPEERIREEIGDLLHSVISLGTFLNYDLEAIIKGATQKFEHRFNALKIISKQKGYGTLHGLQITQLLELWALAKEKAAEDGP